MADKAKGILSTGAGLVLRHQRVLWWVFFVNFILGGLGAASSAARKLSDALSHSLAGQQLSRGFDLGMFLELVERPEVRLFQSAGSSLIFAGLFLLFMLFVTGGILTVYLRNRRLTAQEFFTASGQYFWPMVRLALWSLIPFVVVQLLYQGVSKFSDKIGDQAVDARTGFLLLMVGCIPVLLLFIWVRMWFDLAQVRAVTLENRAMHRNAISAFSLARRSFSPLFWAYVAIGVIAWIVTLVCLAIWAKMPPTALPVTFLLLQIIIIAHIATRLWQKACATTWYSWNPELVPAVLTPFSAPEPVPEEATPMQPPVTDIDRPLSDDVEPAPPESR